MERIRKSCRMVLMEPVPPVDQLTALIVEVARRNAWQEDVFIRPSFYKSTRAIGVRLLDLQHDLHIISLPMGDLIDVTTGIRIRTMSWRRTVDISIPLRAKIAGSYVNSALAKTEAMLNGFDNALVLTHDGHASEGSVENLFMIRDGVLITTSVSDDILEGITRAGIMEMARDMGIPCVERSIDGSELYIADEVFLCGTGAQLSPVIEVDRRTVGGGGIGPLTARLKDRYFDIVRGRVPEYRRWLTPIYDK